MNGLGKEFDKFLKDYEPPAEGATNKEMLRQQDLYIKFTAYRVNDIETQLHDYSVIRGTVKVLIKSVWILGTGLVGTCLWVFKGPLYDLGKMLAKYFGGD